jgi:hypothetical protein
MEAAGQGEREYPSLLATTTWTGSPSNSGHNLVIRRVHSAAFGRNPNYHSRKKRKKAKKREGWSLRSFSPFLRLFSFLAALFSYPLAAFLVGTTRCGTFAVR